MKYIFCLLLLLLGCSNRPPLRDGSREFLFPYGTYQHAVAVEIIPDPAKGPKSFDFRGIFIFSKDQIKLIGLSPLGTTLFRIEENIKTNEIKFETYMDVLKKAESQIRNSYALMKGILTISLKNLEKENVRDSNSKGFPIEIEMVGSSPAKIYFKKYDENNIPGFVEILNANYVIKVKVTDYEF